MGHPQLTELVKSVGSDSHALAARLICANKQDRESLLQTGKEVIGAQFQPLWNTETQKDRIGVLLLSDVAVPDVYKSFQDADGQKYVIVDEDYIVFMRRSDAFGTAEKALRTHKLFDHIAHIRKVYLPSNVLYKSHRTQKYLPQNKPNPQYAQHSAVFTVSAGSASLGREEVVKYAPGPEGKGIVFGPYNPVEPQLLKTPNDKITVLQFLSKAHFPLEEA